MLPVKHGGVPWTPELDPFWITTPVLDKFRPILFETRHQQQLGYRPPGAIQCTLDPRMADTESFSSEVEVTICGRRIETCVKILELSGSEECVSTLKCASQ
jgi:hypothetical protein